jgi:hypothetical protein
LANPGKDFWFYVEKGSDCWIWIGGRDFRVGKHYGRYRGRAAHRVAWELTRGPIPEGLQVLHRCDNPPCVKPSHLFLGTNQDNIRDMIGKGRGGDRKHALIPEQVVEIRRKYGEGASTKELAEQYDIGIRSIWSIVTYRTWKQVANPNSEDKNVTVAESH